MSDPILLQYLQELYGAVTGEQVYPALNEILLEFKSNGLPGLHQPQPPLNHADAILITYPNQVSEPGVKPLVTLSEFARRHLAGLVTGLHILPFFPSSSDDGFAVIDYTRVDPEFGSWAEIRSLGQSFRLMVDAVINHISSQSAWFQGFLSGDSRYQDYFIHVDPGTDISQVVRPRALPLLTPFRTTQGEKLVWTTFSADQVDLNYGNPQVLLDVIKVLLQYVAEGAQFIRLDAIAYLWKEVGTRCIHLPQTHAIIRFFRAVLDEVSPHVLLITETNVPHLENISYFWKGAGEAQLVYNFALPPLVLHTFLTGNSQALAQWAAELRLPSRQVTFLNFLASHDGIGINPVRGILSPAEIDRLVTTTQKNGGLIGIKTDPGGGESAYELNINYFDALNPPGKDPLALQIDRFIAAHAILLSLQGLPAIYFHSLLGSRGWPEGVITLGYNRAINRQKLEGEALETELADPRSLRAQIYQRFTHLLRARVAEPAFDPYGDQQVLRLGSGVFAFVRSIPSGGNPVLCLHNVTQEPQAISIPEKIRCSSETWKDLISGGTVSHISMNALLMAPYQTLWLIPIK